MSKNGFTLAEVLITLGIIGIVAAITMSTIISKIQDRQYRAQWKTAYSQISNVFNLVYQENPDITASWDNEFIQEFKGKFEVIDECGRFECGHDFSKPCSHPACGPNFPWSGLSFNHSSYQTLAKGSLNSYDFYTAAFLLKNGASVYIGGLWSGPVIMVDVNNANKGPNVLGRDLFGISCIPANKCTKLIPMGGENPYPYTPYVYNGKQTACSKDIGLKNSDSVYQASGAGCAAKYLLE